MQQEVVYRDVTAEDMPNEDMRLVADLCGIETAMSLLHNLDGISIYIPKSGLNTIKQRWIRKNCSKYSVKEMAVMLRVTERFVYKTLESRNDAAAQISFLPEDKK